MACQLLLIPAKSAPSPSAERILFKLSPYDPPPGFSVKSSPSSFTTSPQTAIFTGNTLATNSVLLAGELLSWGKSSLFYSTTYTSYHFQQRAMPTSVHLATVSTESQNSPSTTDNFLKEIDELFDPMWTPGPYDYGLDAINGLGINGHLGVQDPFAPSLFADPYTISGYLSSSETQQQHLQNAAAAAAAASMQSQYMWYNPAADNNLHGAAHAPSQYAYHAVDMLAGLPEANPMVYHGTAAAVGSTGGSGSRMRSKNGKQSILSQRHANLPPAINTMKFRTDVRAANAAPRTGSAATTAKGKTATAKSAKSRATKSAKSKKSAGASSSILEEDEITADLRSAIKLNLNKRLKYRMLVKGKMTAEEANLSPMDMQEISLQLPNVGSKKAMTAAAALAEVQKQQHAHRQNKQVQRQEAGNLPNHYNYYVDHLAQEQMEFLHQQNLRQIDALREQEIARHQVRQAFMPQLYPVVCPPPLPIIQPAEEGEEDDVDYTPPRPINPEYLEIFKDYVFPPPEMAERMARAEQSTIEEIPSPSVVSEKVAVDPPTKRKRALSATPSENQAPAKKIRGEEMKTPATIAEQEELCSLVVQNPDNAAENSDSAIDNADDIQELADLPSAYAGITRPDRRFSWTLSIPDMQRMSFSFIPSDFI
ncbi:uncharacterized protein EV422DRAFT_521343 [Fimicolochytrium jonesii]|uniref:uncharacterized protein n=1 Tax=Fimicolochytrium jonesii TaxID=1396493 RepID=UPI0022FE42EC|nr:uncharacterized protein EV422DRAFT_521343 [Fimicolochytrium jonesii]KAI8823537.1 hypothetical protein EV422DRAFT_521343 [Fimicolochytrium jonesii]